MSKKNNKKTIKKVGKHVTRKAIKVISKKAAKIKKTANVATLAQESRGKRAGSFGLLRGFKDVLPEEQKYWDFVRSKVEKIAMVYGFGKIETPILEETALFKRAVGEETDIVEKEMFAFADQGDEPVCLRPEATASVVRAYIEHGMLNRPQPVKLWYWGPMFRHDRPQAGRFRQFTQFGFEVIGADDAVIDAQLILLFYKICEELKLNVNVQINSIGCPECRPEYRRALIEYLRIKKNFLCDDCKNRLDKNPLRVLDCKNEECRRLVAEAPQIIDFLCDDCKNHFIRVLEALEECGVPYNLNAKLVRGLDYYTKTVFEIWPDQKTEAGNQKPEDDQRTGEEYSNNRVDLNNEESNKTKDDLGNLALGGGGRYDGLAKILGARDCVPASGFAAGLERIVMMLKKQNIKIPPEKSVEVFLAQLGDQAKKISLKLFEALRKGGVKVAENLSKDGLRAQLEQADGLKVKYTIIIGQKEVLDKTIIIRDMENGVQEMADLERAVEEVKKRLK